MKNVTYVSAGAGSGKTYYLTEKLSSILAEGRLKGENIMMTTFTELAAGELKRKAKAKLFGKGMVQEAEEVDLANIGTIHSVATSFLEKYWYLLGHSPKMNVITEEDTDFFFNQSLSSILTEEEVSFLSEVAETLVIPIPGSKNEIDKDFWKNQLKSIVESARLYSIDSLTDSLNVSLAFTTKMRAGIDIPTDKKFVEKELKSFERAFQDNKRENNNTDSSREEIIKEAYGKLRLAGENLELRDLIWFRKTFQKLFNTQYYKVVFGESNFFSPLTSLYVSNNYWDYIDKYIKTVFSVAERWRDGYLDYKKKMKLIDFDDMERYFLSLLEVPEVQEDIRKRYKVVFVDEYQDCSPLQVKMFDKISELVDHSYWVGDLKQAIYGFRGTDTNLVQKIVSKVEESQGSNREYLEYSWRSNKNLVEFVNHAFSRSFSSTLKKEDVVLKSVKDKEGTLSILNANDEDDANDAIARYILSLIKGGETPSSIAVLIRTNREEDKLAESLKKYGIEVNNERTIDTTNPLVDLVVSILSLVVDSKDRLAKAKIARLSRKGATTGAIIDGILSTNDDSYLDSTLLVRKTIAISSRIKGYSVSKMVEALLIELNLYDKAKEMKSVEGSKEILDSILEKAKEYEKHALDMFLPSTISGFIIEISKEKGIVIPGNKDGVNILTMHKSKGLEWKTVIIGSLSDDRCKEKRVLQGYFNVNVIASPTNVNEKVIRVLPWIFAKTDKNFPPEIMERIPEGDLDSLKKSRIEEIKRLMYVAITRAKENLCLVSEGKEPFKWLTNIAIQPSMGYDGEDSFDYFSTGDEFSIFTAPASEERLVVEDDGYVLKESGEEVQYEKRDLQPSALPPQESVKVSLEKDFSMRITVSGTPDSALVGTAIHDVFCVLEKKKDEEFISSIISDHGFSKEIPYSREVLNSWNNLESYLKDRYGEEYNTLHECPFTYKEDGFEVSGSIDLVWETKEGVILIDYKTFPGKKTSILNPDDFHYAGKYSGQFSCYKKALEKSGRKVLASYVYYPVAGCLVRLEY